MRKIKGFILFSLLPLLAAAPAQARDLQGRLGLGFNDQFANSRVAGSTSVPAVALKYAFTKDLALETALGFSTATPTNSVIGFKLFKNIFFETNLNFYAMGGLGLVRASGHSGTDFIAGFGSEFFIPGLESVGFSFEMGAAMTNITGSTALSTFGATFLDAGMRFYF